MIVSRIKLIPRYNWDYGFFDHLRALGSVFRSEQKKGEIWQKMFGSKPILTTSGRTSLYLILKALRLPPGSYVGVPLFCCSVVFDAVQQADLVPIFLDIDMDDYSISVSDLAKKKDNLSAVVVVHMFGHPAKMDLIRAVADDLPVIEDCAQSLFSRYKGQYTGFLSDVSFFSFRSGKYISAGEGSAIFAKEPALYEMINELAQEQAEWSWHHEIKHFLSTYIKSTLYKRPWYGIFSLPVGKLLDRRLNLTDKSGFNLGKIAKSDLGIITNRLGVFFQQVECQRKNAHYLIENVKMPDVVLPQESDECQSNYYQFVIRFKDVSQRDLAADFLFRRGIDGARYLDDIVPFARQNYRYQGDCPNAEKCSKTILSIPHYYSLSDRDIKKISRCLNEVGQKLSESRN